LFAFYFGGIMGDEEKKIRYFYYSIVGIGAFLLFGLMVYAYFSAAETQTSEPKTKANESASATAPAAEKDIGTYENLAKCLTAKGAVLYGASWCPHCQRQKALFGDMIKDIKYVECQAPNGGQTEECANAGIKAYPTWIINGKQYLGEKSLEELARLTGCSV